METLAEPMQILLTEDTYELVRDEFSCLDRGEIEVKGFGLQRVFSLESESGRR
jgi:class 3 adenylate cyclase